MAAAAAAAFLSRFLLVPRAAAARYVARGPYLLLSWALAAALFVGSHAALFAAWPRIAAALPAQWLWAMFASTTAVNVGAQLLLNLALLPLYVTGAADAARSEPSRPWPWAGGAAERARFWAALAHGVPLVVFNMLVVSLAGLATLAPVVRALGVETRFDVAGFPSLATLAWQLAVCLVVEDAMFYASHRALHTPALYAAVHKVHHEYSSVIGPASEHAHPVEFLLGNLLPVIAGPLLLRAHGATLLLFLALRVAVSIEEHSGFSFAASPLRVTPFAALTAGHAWHHSHVVGVYASQFCWLDAFFGTDAAFTKWLAAEDARGKTGAKTA